MGMLHELLRRTGRWRQSGAGGCWAIWHDRLTPLTLFEHVRESGHTLQHPHPRFLKHTHGRETRQPEDHHAHLDVNTHPMTRSLRSAHCTAKSPMDRTACRKRRWEHRVGHAVRSDGAGEKTERMPDRVEQDPHVLLRLEVGEPRARFPRPGYPCFEIFDGDVEMGHHLLCTRH